MGHGVVLYLGLDEIGSGVGPYLGLDKIGSPSLIMIFIIISYLFNRTFWIYLLEFLLVPINSILFYCFCELDMILKT